MKLQAIKHYSKEKHGMNGYSRADCSVREYEEIIIKPNEDGTLHIMIHTEIEGKKGTIDIPRARERVEGEYDIYEDKNSEMFTITIDGGDEDGT